MWLTKDGITIEVTHPAEIARYKKFGYVEERLPAPVVEEKPAEPVAPEVAQQEQDQATAERIVQPEKAKKAKVQK